MAVEHSWQFERIGDIAHATLHTPHNHNTLTLPAIHALTDAFLEWLNDGRVEGIILRGGDNRVFSTGGDLVAIHEARGRHDRTFGADYFRAEFQLDHLIATAPKPVMAIMNGLTLGGGAGIAAHALIRVATDTTLFAMPETGLGYFPDCGAALFLNRCPGFTGTYLGLTGQRIQAPDLCALGLATHYVPLADLPELDFTTLPSLAREPRPAQMGVRREIIDRVFSEDTVTGIVAALEATGTATASQILATLRRQNSVSLSVALLQLRTLKGADPATIFRTEYRICQHFLDGEAFYEGIRAAVIDKDLKPIWPRIDCPLEPVASYFEVHATIADWEPLVP